MAKSFKPPSRDADAVFAEFEPLYKAKKAAMLSALRAALARVNAAGLRGAPGFEFTLGEDMETIIAHPYLMADPALLHPQVILNKVAQFWAPSELSQRWQEQRLLPLFLEHRAATGA